MRTGVDGAEGEVNSNTERPEPLSLKNRALEASLRSDLHSLFDFPCS